MLELVLYPEPILRSRAAEIATIDGAVRERVARMFEIMYGESGVGLAAPQVGWSGRLFIFNAVSEQPPEGERVFINPRIIERGEEEDIDEEGCLSIPDLRGKVKRSRRVVVESRGLDGEIVREEFVDLEARVFQHELDHLNGVLFIRHLSPTEKLFAKKLLRRLEKDYKERQRAARPATASLPRAERGPVGGAGRGSTASRGRGAGRPGRRA